MIHSCVLSWPQPPSACGLSLFWALSYVESCSSGGVGGGGGREEHGAGEVLFS